MIENKDRVWLAYTHNGQYVKVVFEGFGFGGERIKEFEKHPRYAEFCELVQEVARKVWSDLENESGEDE